MKLVWISPLNLRWGVWVPENQSGVGGELLARFRGMNSRPGSDTKQLDSLLEIDLPLYIPFFFPSRKKGVGPLGLPWRRAAWLPPTVLVGFSEVWEGQIPGGEQSSRVIRSCSICHLLQHHSPDNPVTKHRAQDGPQGGLEEFMPLAGQLPLTRLIWKGWGLREE